MYIYLTRLWAQVRSLRDMRLAQLDRAFGYGPKGRGFESSNARYYKNAGNLYFKGFPVFLRPEEIKKLL